MILVLELVSPWAYSLSFCRSHNCPLAIPDAVDMEIKWPIWRWYHPSKLTKMLVVVKTMTPIKGDEVTQPWRWRNQSAADKLANSEDEGVQQQRQNCVAMVAKLSVGDRRASSRWRREQTDNEDVDAHQQRWRNPSIMKMKKIVGDDKRNRR